MKLTHGILFLTISFMAASALFLFLVLHPIFQGVLHDHEEILTQKLQSAEIQQDRNNLKDFQNVFARYQNEFVQLEALFLDTQTPIDFFRFLDTTSSGLQISLEKNPGARQQKKGDPWPSMDIQVQGTGAYPNIVAFLEKVENAPYLLEITNMSIISSRAKAARGQANPGENILSMTIKVYTK